MVHHQALLQAKDGLEAALAQDPGGRVNGQGVRQRDHDVGCVADDQEGEADRAATQVAENACTEWEFEKILEQGAASFIQPSVTKVGGISEFSNIIQLSDNYNVPIMPHSAYFGPGFLSTLHLTSQFKHETYIERFYLDLYEEFYPEFKKTKDGFYLLPDGPGLGMDFDESIIRKFKI